MANRRPIDLQLTYLAAFAAAPALIATFALLWGTDLSSKVRWTVAAAVLVVWAGALAALRERIVRTLQTLSNLLGGLREGDYSLRGRAGRRDDPLAEVFIELNALSDMLREERLAGVEASKLLGQVMDEIDVAIIAIDEGHRVRLANRAAEELLGTTQERLLGRTAEEVGLRDCVEGEAPRTLERSFAGVPGRWELRRREFRQGGLPHVLIVLTDLRRALREEERQAWQRLVRVLGHEINNSLTPIRSIASSLGGIVGVATPDASEDMRAGLEVIVRRSEGLSRFMAAYANLAKLPPPKLAEVDVRQWVERVVKLEDRVPIRVEPGPEGAIVADGDQLDQVLINLVKNAAEASLLTKGSVRVTWIRRRTELEVLIEDEGPGLPESANLFVPFFTTKPGGTGLGLVLSRHITEAHRGTITLENRGDRTGCRARLRLPIDPSKRRSTVIRAE